MALTKISTDGVKDDAVTAGKIPANAVGSSELADQSVSLDKLPHGDGSSDGKFLRSNNGADPTFETVAAATGQANTIQTTDGSGAFTASTFKINGDVLSGHDLQLEKDSSNVDPVIGAAGGGTALTFRTNQNGASGAGVASILDLNGLQMGRMSQYVKLAAPTDQSGQASYTFTFPPISGTSGQALTTNGSGTTSWTTINSDLVSDTSPQLGGNLDTNGNDIDFADNVKATFGASEDLLIKHSGTNSEIYHNGTGHLYIATLGSSEDVNLQSTGKMTFATNSSERLRIHNSGDVEVKTGSLIIGTAGEGIDFGATANASNTGASMSNERLEDYEEGSFTPTPNTGTWTATNAKYVRIGRMCFINAHFGSVSDTTSSTAIKIPMTSLPFNKSSFTDNIYMGTCPNRYFSHSSKDTLMYWSMDGSGIHLYSNNDASGDKAYTAVEHKDIDASYSAFQIAGWYCV